VAFGPRAAHALLATPPPLAAAAAAAAAAAVVVVAVVLLVGNLAFRTHTTSTFYAQSILCHVLRCVPRHVLRRVLHVLVLNVSPKGRRGR